MYTSEKAGSNVSVKAPHLHNAETISTGTLS